MELLQSAIEAAGGKFFTGGTFWDILGHVRRPPQTRAQCAPPKHTIPICNVKWRLAGEATPVKNSLIAATTLVHDLTVVTRNVRDFKKAGPKVLNPFAKVR
jgi:hypothetical protein